MRLASTGVLPFGAPALHFFHCLLQDIEILNLESFGDHDKA
jgi:hypothetical protein